MPIDRQPDGLNGSSLAVFPYKCARTCFCHRRGKGLKLKAPLQQFANVFWNKGKIIGAKSKMVHTG